MASLYIEDSETAELACKLGVTETDVVRNLLRWRKAELAVDAPSQSIDERLRAWRAARPLGEPTGLEADKPFHDSLNDEEDD